MATDTTGMLSIIFFVHETYLLSFRFVVNVRMDGVRDQEKAEKEG